MMGFYPDESRDDLGGGSNVSDNSPQPFQGDTFGGFEDYMDDDFGQAFHSQSASRSHEDDVEQSNKFPDSTDDPNDDEELLAASRDADLEDGWEPDRSGASAAIPTPSNSSNENLQPYGNLDSEEIAANRQVESRLDDKSLTVRYSDSYPNRQAGAALKQKQPHDAKYCDMINGSTNPWAPFSSRMDWEIAKWAKLRGAGSTAFTDLLAIEGVRSSDLILSCSSIDDSFAGPRSTSVVVQEFK
jgi:hypothetical protein